MSIVQALISRVFFVYNLCSFFLSLFKFLSELPLLFKIWVFFVPKFADKFWDKNTLFWCWTTYMPTSLPFSAVRFQLHTLPIALETVFCSAFLWVERLATGGQRGKRHSKRFPFLPRWTTTGDTQERESRLQRCFCTFRHSSQTLECELHIPKYVECPS